MTATIFARMRAVSGACPAGAGEPGRVQSADALGDRVLIVAHGSAPTVEQRR